MRPRVMCWQDYSPDCCRGGYTTIIIRRYLIHFIRVLKYLGAVFILWCSCHTKPHIWCVSSQHKQLNVSLFFRSNLPTNCSRFTWVYYTFSTSPRWLWILKYYNICFLPLLSHPICSQHWLLFKWRKKRCWNEVTLQQSGVEKYRRGCKHDAVSVRAIVQIQINQSVQMKCLHNNNKVLTLLLKPDLWLRGPAERQHSEHTPDEMKLLSLFVKCSDRSRPFHTHMRTCKG